MKYNNHTIEELQKLSIKDLISRLNYTHTENLAPFTKDAIIALYIGTCMLYDQYEIDEESYNKHKVKPIVLENTRILDL